MRAGLMAALLAAASAQAQSTTPGYVIRNTGLATFVDGGGTQRTAASNEVLTIVEPPRSSASLQLLRASPPGGGAPSPIGPTQCLNSGGALQPLPDPVLIGGGTLDASQPANLSVTASYHGGEAVFVQLTDGDQNRDGTVRDTVDVRLTSPASGDTETVRLTETAVNSGVFVVYLQTATQAVVPGDCVLEVARDSTLESTYADPRDATDSARLAAIVDPTGLVFDSHTGQPVSGVRIRLVDAITGLPAQVKGDDGVSTFPSEIVSGAQATDSGGTVYAFAPGAFRFPVVPAPGTYRYEVIPPASYRFPSTVAPAALQLLPGAPFVLPAASFGADLPVGSPTATAIDLPLDPTGTTLFLQKAALNSVAAPGDFVQYTLTLENAGTSGDIDGTSIVDVLPPGVRYRQGSARITRGTGSTQLGPDPQIASDGRTLTFATGTLAPGERVSIRYVVEITVTARPGNIVNRASAVGAGNLTSNSAAATVLLREALNRDRGFIMGRVADGGCETPFSEAHGVEGVRVYLEDGRYSVTDSEGKYHFEDLVPGTHVVQIDSDTVPDTLEALSCGTNNRHAGRAYSQFVDLSGSSLWRADFRLTTRQPPQGTVDLALAPRPTGLAGLTGVRARINVDGVGVGNARLLVMLPAGQAYVPGSARSAEHEVGASASGAMVSFKLGEAAAQSSHDLDFDLRTTSYGTDPVRAVLMFDSPTQTGQQTSPVELPLNADVTPGPAATRVQTRGVLQLLKSKSRPVASAVEESEGELLPNIESLATGVGWVLPQEDFSPAIRSLKAAVRHLPGQTVELRVNDAPVSPLNFYGTAENGSHTVALSLWRGVDIPEGTSQLLAIVRNAQGQEIDRLIRQVDFAGGPALATFDSAGSVLVADGRTRPLIRLRVNDSAGHPARRGTLGTYRVDPPQRSWFEVEALTDNQLVATGHREPTYTVADGGSAAIELEPTTRSGQVVLHLKFADGREQEVRAWLKPAARNWVLVGIAEGTAAYHTLSQNMEAAQDAGHEEGITEDGRVALFAKGRIRGDYLLTLAYDSAREHDRGTQHLGDVIEPDRYYTLYGDGSEQRNEAASTSKLYLKLEREQFFALFGDFDTGLTVTELTRYSRTLNGLQTQFAGDHVSVNAFAAHTAQNFVRDELRGDGTSGLYRLSRTPLLVGSEKLRLETRDRFHSESVLESRALARFLDYSIDYQRGEIFFKEPVLSRDVDFNPVYIVVEYETDEAASEAMTAGGRAAVKLPGDAVELGASFVQEGAQAGDRQVGGVDMHWQMAAATQFKAEYAHSNADPTVGPGSANAYVAELTHTGARADARIYAREQEQGFGLGQQAASESGTRKVGADGRYNLNDRFSVQGEAYQQEYTGNAAERQAASAELHYQDEARGVGFGLRHVSDDVQGVETRSDTAFVAASMDILDERLRLRASADTPLGGNDSSIDFPARSVLGADWRIGQDSTLFAEYEHAAGAAISSDMTRLGVRASPWTRGQIASSVSAEESEYGPRTFANLGLTQGFQLTERWGLDFGIDQSHTLTDGTARPLTPQVPLASGNLGADYFAAFAGALYRSDLWTFTSRTEYRDSDLEQRVSLSGGFYREPVAGHAFSLALFALNSDMPAGVGSSQVDLRFGWAFRPIESRWILLDRLDLVYDSQAGPDTSAEAWKLINSFNANWQFDAGTQLALDFGARYTRSTFDAARYTGYSDIYGIELRRDLGARFDVGVHTQALNSWSSDLHQYAVGFDVGYTIARNVWVAVGYNFDGFHDEDFSANRYTDQGPFIKLRIKADQDTLRDLGARF